MHEIVSFSNERVFDKYTMDLQYKVVDTHHYNLYTNLMFFLMMHDTNDALKT